MVLTPDAAKRIGDIYPELKPTTDFTALEGRIRFVASYDPAQDKFFVAGPGSETLPGERIEGEYGVSIRPFAGEDDEAKMLPRLYITEPTIEPLGDRHFSKGGSACVCGMSEEAGFVARGMEIEEFIERLAVPFLYAQSYYELHRKWPWGEYAHNVAGVLESFHHNGSQESIALTLDGLRIEPAQWERLKAVLIASHPPKGHMPCVCQRDADYIRRCHPSAWEGLKRLYQATRKNPSMSSGLTSSTV